MEFLNIFIAGFVLSLSLCFDIGIVNTAIINTAIRKGFQASFLIGLGSCFGDLTYALLSTTGLVVLFKIPSIRIVFWVSGNILLIIVILRMVVEQKKEINLPTPKIPLREKPLSYLSNGFVLSIASPTTIIWFVSIGAAMIASYRITTPSFVPWIFFLGFFIAGLVWSFTLSITISVKKTFLKRKILQWINWISILLLVFLCGYSIINGFRNLF